jgi:hypothetical protein
MEVRDAIDFRHGSNTRDDAQPVSFIIPAKAGMMGEVGACQPEGRASNILLGSFAWHGFVKS